MCNSEPKLGHFDLLFSFKDFKCSFYYLKNTVIDIVIDSLLLFAHIYGNGENILSAQNAENFFIPD